MRPPFYWRAIKGKLYKNPIPRLLQTLSGFACLPCKINKKPLIAFFYFGCFVCSTQTTPISGLFGIMWRQKIKHLTIMCLLTPPYIIFFIMCISPVLLKGFHDHFVACGKCIECKMARSNEWSFRIMDEASLYEKNCFVTLTYNDNNLPDGASLKRSDLQAFIKRLRRRLDNISIRYFYCGEYGSEEKTHRPHYHIIFFGYVPDDLYFFKYSRKKEPMFRSPFLEDVWSVPVYDDNGKQLFAKNGKPLTTPIGFVSVELLENIAQARYIALYMQVKPKNGKIAPFVGMSQGIGKGAINFDNLKIDGRLYHNGKYIRAPRYYRKKAKENGIDLSCSPVIVDTDKQKLAYLKKVYYRQINFFRRFPSLGKPVFDFFKLVIYRLFLFSDHYHIKSDEKYLNSLKKLDK